MTDCNIDTNNILAFLIQNGIYCDCSFTSLTVADDKLTLTSAYRKHRVYCENTGFHWCTNRLSVNDTRCRIFNRTIVNRMNFALSVNWNAESIYYSANKFITNGNTCSFACSFYRASFADFFITAEKNTAYFAIP